MFARVAVDTVRGAGLALNRMACVMRVNQDGTALAVTSAVQKVIMVIAVRRFAQNAETKSHVTRKLECVYAVTLAGLD